jgi:diguanylate cyclase (GGDEF)-like protein/PAS domain S-box-containing protein
MPYTMPAAGLQRLKASADYPVPKNETERMAALKSLMILDTPREAALDALVQLACEIFTVPIGIISLVDSDRQWFKAAVGMDITETKRQVAFCNLTLAESAPLVVNDASQDPRFSANPLVIGAPGIRFYAGVPLVLSPGVNAGSFCIIDKKPRQIDDDGLRRLQYLAEIAVALFGLGKITRDVARRAESISRQTEVISAQTAMLNRQKNILDRASGLAKLGAWEVDLQSSKIDWSEGMYALHEVDHTFEIKADKVLSFYPQPDRDRFISVMEKSRKENKPYTYEGRMFTAKGRLRWIRVAGDVDMEGGNPVRRVGLVQDITDEKEMLTQIQELARRDELTGLLNRKALRVALADLAAIPVIARKSIALLVFDIDNFKEVNDTQGHAAGDACLRHVARRLQIAGGDGCTIARLGGDEFAILLYDDLADTPEVVAERIRSSVAMPLSWDGHSLQCTTSIGIAMRGKGANVKPDDLIGEADLALYDAKAAGRNRYRTFRLELQAASQERSKTVRDVRRALAMRHLELYFQPKISLRDGRHLGFEALLRWNKSAQTVLAPGQFPAALEDPVLSKDIGDYVIASAISQAKAWENAKVPFGHIAINLAASQFRDPNLAEHLIREMDVHGLDRSAIEVEVTESVFLSTSSNSVLVACKAFRENRIRIAFDDFGTGFASLTHLQDFPVDIIKIERSFISKLGRGDNATAIVNAMVGLAHNLSMEIVAEGVETTAQADFLKAIGCDQAQGYLYGRPQPAPAAIQSLTGNRLILATSEHPELQVS